MSQQHYKSGLLNHFSISIFDVDLETHEEIYSRNRVKKMNLEIKYKKPRVIEVTRTASIYHVFENDINP